MLESLKSIVSAFKAGAVEAGAKAYINQKIQNFGEVTSLQIDPLAKTILLEASLKGETTPVLVKVIQYEVISTPEAAHLVLKRFDASREWIGAVLNEYVAGQKFTIPASIQKVL